MMKRLSLFALVLMLSACAVTPQLAARMTNDALCSYTPRDQAISHEIHMRRLDCRKVIRAAVRRSVAVENPLQLCTTWYNAQGMDNIDLVNREVKKRGLDCPAIVQRQQQLRQMQVRNDIEEQKMQDRRRADDARRHEDARRRRLVDCVPVSDDRVLCKDAEDAKPVYRERSPQ